MAVKFETKLETFQENAWPAMVQVLADQLKVSAASLCKLGVGFVPVAPFKDKKTGKPKPNFKGWWCNPERDAEGDVTGLSLRGMDGFKVMYPGSSHGLVYELSPNFVSGQPVYSHGSHNWLRTMDAGVDCPICDKPDGCLVSAENPHDPQAVICIRIKDGATKPQKFGYLHIRKDEGHVNTGSPLCPSEHPVIVVEGMSDTAAALDLGFVGVGRPSALGGMDLLADLCRGRKVILIGENDSPDKYGRIAGLQGLDSAFETLKPVCPSVIRILPPADVKDLRAWKIRYDLGMEGLLKYTAEYGTSESSREVLEDKAPLWIAEHWLRSHQSKDGIPLLRKFRGQWFRFGTTAYDEVEEAAVIRGGLYAFLQGKSYKEITIEGNTVVKSYEATRAKVSDIVDALNMSCPIMADPPCWLDNREEPNPKRLICFPNGVLDVDGYLIGDAELIEASPHLFTLAALPYDWDTKAKCPLWLDWLKETLGDDTDKIKLLQEWFGYCMTPDMSMEKLMLFQGRSRSGKGTALEVLRALVGSKQVSSTSFGSLCSQFGKAPLVGKLIAIMPDARLPKRTDSMQALETLLAIVGQDGIDIDRKNLTSLADHKLTTRFTIAVNELPELPDHSQALEPRLNILHFAQSFKGKENRSLKVRLPREAPGIAVWALEGLRRLREQGVFTVPLSSNTLVDEFRRVTSPIAEFVEEACLTDETRKIEITKLELFEAWTHWCRERGLQSGYRSKFTQRLMAVHPEVGDESKVDMGKKTSVYTGITLQTWAQTAFLGKPGA